MKVEIVQRELQDRDEALRQLKNYLARAQDRMKTQVDKHRKEMHFEIGDLVFLKLKQHSHLGVIFV